MRVASKACKLYGCFTEVWPQGAYVVRCGHREPTWLMLPSYTQKQTAKVQLRETRAGKVFHLYTPFRRIEHEIPVSVVCITSRLIRLDIRSSMDVGP